MSKNATLAGLLLAPLLVLIVVGFLLPVGMTLARAFENPEISLALPRTTAVLAQWDGTRLPGEAAFTALKADLTDPEGSRAFGAMTRRLNFEQAGLRTLLTQTRRDIGALPAPVSSSLPAMHEQWADPALWGLIRTHSSPVTATYVLRALDLRLAPDGAIVPVEAEQAIFRDLFARTFEIAAWVTVLCVLAGYPAAWFLSTLTGRAAGIALLCVLVPFWTSILVRATAWFILLQREGVVNAALAGLSLIEEPQPMIFSRFAVYVAMVHVLLPYVILPLHAVMRRIEPQHLRAAASLGAPPWRQFAHVYLPMTLPGVAAGGLMVFMLCVGFYVTPALVGGLQDQMVGYYIAFYTNTSINLGMAAALALLLLVFTFALVVLARRLVPGFSGGIAASGIKS